MGVSIFPPISKTRYVVTLTSGTSWTVPTGVTYVNVTLRGGGGAGGAGIANNVFGQRGVSGQVVSSTLSTTPGASITYAIGAGGTASGGAGGTTTFTGATSASGGAGANNMTTAGSTGSNSQGADNYGLGGGYAGSSSAGGAGGSGSIDVEYWV